MQWDPYVPSRERKLQGAKAASRADARGSPFEPVRASGRQIASTFWGRAWCQHLERFCDYDSRLPRGRRYLGNGSVLDLRLEPGRVVAKVQGSHLYTVTVKVMPLPPGRWRPLVASCAGRVGSALELLSGKLSDLVMATLTDPYDGLFPRVGEMNLGCTCPDSAAMCKHVAAALYGVGVRLDTTPALLFTLRGVDQAELIAAAGSTEALDALAGSRPTDTLAGEDLGKIFGLDFDTPSPAPEVPAPVEPRRTARRPTSRKRELPDRPAALDPWLAKIDRLLAPRKVPFRSLKKHFAELDGVTRGIGDFARTHPDAGFEIYLRILARLPAAYRAADGRAHEDYLQRSMGYFATMIDLSPRTRGGRVGAATAMLTALLEDEVGSLRELPAALGRIAWKPTERKRFLRAVTAEIGRVDDFTGLRLRDVERALALAPSRAARRPSGRRRRA